MNASLDMKKPSGIEISAVNRGRRPPYCSGTMLSTEVAMALIIPESESTPVNTPAASTSITTGTALVAWRLISSDCSSSRGWLMNRAITKPPMNRTCSGAMPMMSSTISSTVSAALAYMRQPTFFEGVSFAAAISARSSATAAGSTRLRCPRPRTNAITSTTAEVSARDGTSCTR